MSEHELTEDLLSAYLDDELDASARAAVDARLAASTEWQAILDEVRATRDALRGLPALEGPPAFWVRVMLGDSVPDDAIRGEAQPDQVIDLGAERRRRRMPRWGLAAAGAAAAAVIVVGVVAVPQQDRVRPAVAVLSNEHAARSSVGNDVISSLVSIAVPTNLGR
jgi:anti-sigma factor RsiW